LIDAAMALRHGEHPALADSAVEALGSALATRLREAAEG
jgi:hypothetical protein